MNMETLKKLLKKLKISKIIDCIFIFLSVEKIFKM